MTVATGTAAVSVGSQLVTRAEVEDFLYAEADILDAWDYDSWLALFEPGARFEIPTTDFDGRASSAEYLPQTSGSFINDDWDLIRARVKRLKSRKAHAENPPSLTHRLVSNVRLFDHGDREAPALRATASFVVSRARDGQFDTYFGRYDHVLAVAGDGLRFRRRRSILRHEFLGPGARLSFIL